MLKSQVLVLFGECSEHHLLLKVRQSLVFAYSSIGGSKTSGSSHHTSSELGLNGRDDRSSGTNDLGSAIKSLWSFSLQESANSLGTSLSSGAKDLADKVLEAVADVVEESQLLEMKSSSGVKLVELDRLDGHHVGSALDWNHSQ